MPHDARPRRSALFMPGSNLRAMEKARSLAADVVIFDIEDAVSPDAKPAARAAIAAAVAAGGYGRRELVVRVNAVGTPWNRDDLAAVARMGVDAVLLPKVDDAETLHRAEAALIEAGAPTALKLWCMMETPRGILHAEAIASASPRVGALIAGTADLGKDLRARHRPDRMPMLTSLQLCLLAARAYGLAALDGVHFDITDDAGFAESCRQGRDLGFDGKTLIHPRTIAAANEIFAPDTEELGWARRVIAAHDQAEAAGKGVAVLDGKLVESLHVEEARRSLALADAIAALEKDGSSP
jgi:citrate lyase subunit beta / citryl-CoA lyase